MSAAADRPRVALVTRGRRGIGRAIGYALPDEGFDVVVNDLVRDAAAEETLAGIDARGGRTQFVIGDVAAVDGHGALVDAAWSAFGGLDCLVNNAGVQTTHRGDMRDVPVESFDRFATMQRAGR